MRKTLGAAVATTALVASTLVGGTAAASHATSVDAMTVAATTSQVTVSGTAHFKDLPITVATDATGDAVPTGLGTDLTKATISRPDPAKNELHFSLEISDPLPQVFAAPEAIHYSFFFSVGPDAATQWLLMGLRTSQYQAAGSTNPVMNLHQFRSDGTCCDPRATLNGSISGNKITWILPMGSIAATTGTLIEAHPVGTRQIQVQIGASGYQRLNNGQPDMMFMDQSYAAPGASVKLGIAPAGTPLGSVPLTASASVTASSGAFSGVLPKPAQAGDYVVVAQACYAPGNCGLSSRTLTI